MHLCLMNLDFFYQVEQDWFKYAVNAIDVGGGADRAFW